MEQVNPRTVKQLKRGWKFIREEQIGAQEIAYDDNEWESVRVPHDWAITGPFDRDNDLQFHCVAAA